MTNHYRFLPGSLVPGYALDLPKRPLRWCLYGAQSLVVDKVWHEALFHTVLAAVRRTKSRQGQVTSKSVK